MVIKADQLPTRDGHGGSGGKSQDGRTLAGGIGPGSRSISEDFANLKVELLIVVKGADPVWVPIRLDRQSLLGAREGALELGVRRVETRRSGRSSCSGEGEHHIEVELQASTRRGRRLASRSRWPFRKRPRPPSTSLFRMAKPTSPLAKTRFSPSTSRAATTGGPV